LHFTVPSYPHIPLVAGGEEKLVVLDNLEEYLERLLNHMLVEGPAPMMKAILAGFNEVSDPRRLRIFSPDEMDGIIIGSATQWTYEHILSSIKCDHGYTNDSRAVQFFVEVLAEMSVEEQRQFLFFVSGTPRLPIGGFQGLQPRLTVVRKDGECFARPEDYLPSVMTCANYVKLPDYPTKEMLRQKLLQAVQEGQQSFHLS
jgi:E3 ubiquitin-protein ligase TRIP12